MRRMNSAFQLSGTVDGCAAVVLASPHSGRYFSPEFLQGTRLPVATLRRLEDAHVGDLLRPAASGAGVPLLEAVHARAVIDLNRGEDEYDARMIAGPLPVAARPTARVASGYGLFPRLAGIGLPIHAGPIAAATAAARIREVHRPWHRALAAALAAARARHGYAVLLDMHSMPTLKWSPAQVVLGSNFGATAAPALVDWLQQAFEAAGLAVARNSPYAGGYTTVHHGQPQAGIHAVQIEIDRGLYMDQQSLVPNAGFPQLTALFAKLLGELQASLPLAGMAGPAPSALAAE